MADPPPHPDPESPTGNAGISPGRQSTAGMPRWVKVLGIMGIVVVLAFVILMFTGGGGHGPGRHTPSDGGPGSHTPPASITEHTRPAGGHMP